MEKLEFESHVKFNVRDNEIECGNCLDIHKMPHEMVAVDVWMKLCTEFNERHKNHAPF